jgi:hypothetical protein
MIFEVSMVVNMKMAVFYDVALYSPIYHPDDGGSKHLSNDNNYHYTLQCLEDDYLILVPIALPAIQRECSRMFKQWHLHVWNLCL